MLSGCQYGRPGCYSGLNAEGCSPVVDTFLGPAEKQKHTEPEGTEAGAAGVQPAVMRELIFEEAIQFNVSFIYYGMSSMK